MPITSTLRVPPPPEGQGDSQGHPQPVSLLIKGVLSQQPGLKCMEPRPDQAYCRQNLHIGLSASKFRIELGVIVVVVVFVSTFLKQGKLK